MDLFWPIDIYCERLGPGFWAEPLNALSNVSYFIAGMALWPYSSHTSRGQNATDWLLRVFIILVFAVGTGSFLFHTFANLITLWADILPIALTFYYSVCLACKRLFGWRTWPTLLLVFFYIMIDVVLQTQFSHIMRQTFNGSLMYTSVAITIPIFAFFSFRYRQPEAGYFLTAAACCFAVSIVIRSIDMALCQHWPLGTHFLWHCLNGLVLYLIGRGLATPKKS